MIIVIIHISSGTVIETFSFKVCFFNIFCQMWRQFVDKMICDSMFYMLQVKFVNSDVVSDTLCHYMTRCCSLKVSMWVHTYFGEACDLMHGTMICRGSSSRWQINTFMLANDGSRHGGLAVHSFNLMVLLILRWFVTVSPNPAFYSNLKTFLVVLLPATGEICTPMCTSSMSK